MTNITFQARVSRGSRYNQIYVPKEWEMTMETGDLVAVTLKEKANRIFYFPSHFKLPEFKEKIVREVFKFLKNEGYAQCFIIGSFLSQGAEYHDIDVAVIGREKTELVKCLEDSIGLKFHLLFFEKNKLTELLGICPLTRLMFSRYLSSAETRLDKKRRKINIPHLEYLLMMPEDLLEISLNSKIFYDNTRRLVAIERFLKGEEENIEKLNKEVALLLGERLAFRLKENQEIDKENLHFIRRVFLEKIKKIKGILHGKKR